MDVGAELRQARERRALSLHDLSRRTKISLPALRAIENNEIDRLPGGIFTRGFLKAYAREVGLDPADISQRYAAQFEPPAVQAVDGAEPALAAEDGEHHDAAKPPATHRVERARMAGTIAALALVALSYFAFTRWQGSTSPHRVERPRSGESVSAANEPSHRKAAPVREAAPTTGSLDTAAPPTEPSEMVLRVDLQPPRLCWISATADGKRVTYRLLLAGERQTIEARSEIVLRIGDPDRFAFSINGSAGRLPGRAGQPTTVRITPRNYRAFLAR